jgi:hypothetical protein
MMSDACDCAMGMGGGRLLVLGFELGDRHHGVNLGALALTASYTASDGILFGPFLMEDPGCKMKILSPPWSPLPADEWIPMV